MGVFMKLLRSMLSSSRWGLRSIHAPVGQNVPTFDDVKVLTTSGTLPLRIAAMILLSTMSPTTFTFTSGCFASYSATSRLNSLSSCVLALQPTHGVSVTGPDDVSFELSPRHPASDSVAASRTKAVAKRFMSSLLQVGDAPLVSAPYENAL